VRCQGNDEIRVIYQVFDQADIQTFLNKEEEEITSFQPQIISIKNGF
jgi:hypothetical protein